MESGDELGGGRGQDGGGGVDRKLELSLLTAETKPVTATHVTVTIPTHEGEAGFSDPIHHSVTLTVFGWDGRGEGAPQSVCLSVCPATRSQRNGGRGE